MKALPPIGRRALLAWLALPAGAARAHGNKAHASAASASALRDGAAQAWGRAGDPRRVSRTVVIEMHDRMRFQPAVLQVTQGETLRLRVHNRGRLLHELVIGTHDELARHAELMRRFPDMEHDAPYMVHVAAGRQADIVWTFDRAGEFMYGCLVAGHWEAGMQGRIRVVPR